MSAKFNLWRNKMLKPLGDRVVLKSRKERRLVAFVSLLVQGKTQQKEKETTSSQSAKASVRSMEVVAPSQSNQVMGF